MHPKFEPSLEPLHSNFQPQFQPEMKDQELGGDEFTPAGKSPQQLVKRVQQRMKEGKKLTNQEMHWAFSHGGFYFHQQAGVHQQRMRMKEDAERKKLEGGVATSSQDGGLETGALLGVSSQAQDGEVDFTASPLGDASQGVDSASPVLSDVNGRGDFTASPVLGDEKVKGNFTASPLVDASQEEKPLSVMEKKEAQKENGQVTPLDASQNAVEQPVLGVMQPKAEESGEEKRRKEGAVKQAAMLIEENEKKEGPHGEQTEEKTQEVQKQEEQKLTTDAKKQVEETPHPQVQTAEVKDKVKKDEAGVVNAEEEDPGPEGVKEDFENPPAVKEVEMKDAQDEAGEAIEADEFANNNLTGLIITAQQFRDKGKEAVERAKEQTNQRLSLESDVKKLENKVAGSDKSLNTAESNTNQREKNLQVLNAPLAESKKREKAVSGSVGEHINTYNENKDEAEDMRKESADMLAGSNEHKDPEDEDSGMLSEKYEELSSGSTTMADGISGGGDTAHRLKAEAETAKKKNIQTEKEIQSTKQKLQQSKDKLNKEKQRNKDAKKTLNSVRGKLEQSKKDEQKLTKEGMDLMKTSFDIENETHRAQYFYYKNMSRVNSRENLLSEEAKAFQDSLLNQGGTDGLLFNYVSLETEEERTAFVDSLSPTQRTELQIALEVFMANYDAWVAANQEQLMLRAEEKRLTQIDAHNSTRNTALKRPLQRVTDNLGKVDKIGLFWSSLTQGLEAMWKSITNITWADVGQFALAMVNPVEFYNTIATSVKGIWTELSDWGGFEKDPVGMILKKGSNVGVQLLTICGVITGLLAVLSIAATIGTIFTAGAMGPLAAWLWSATATMGSVTFWVGVVTAALSALSGIKNAYEMHTAQTAEVLYQNTAELKQDAGNTAVAILGIVGGKGQVSGSKQMLEMIAKYPKTFGKRMFIQMKKSFMRKLTWAPRMVAAMFKKDTWKNLYASLRKYLQRNVDEVTDNKPNRDLKRDPVRENVDNNKQDRNKQNKPDEKDNVKTDRTADNEKATENYKKHEKDVDDAEKKKLKQDADEDVPDGPDSDSKRRALFMAKVITEANDKIDTPIAGLMAELAPLSAMKGVPPFKYQAIGDGVYKVWMNPPVDDNYTAEQSNENDKKKEKKKTKNVKYTAYQKKASKIAKKYEKYQCDKCRDEIVQTISEAGGNGQIIELKMPSNSGSKNVNIWSDFAKDNIAVNGYHTGTMVDNLVFDNIHKNGLPLQEWLDDFHSPQTIIIHKTPF